MKVLIVNSHALNGGDAAILFGEVAALREVFGSDIEVEVTDAQHSAVARLYPELPFFPGFHSERPERPRWRSRGLAGSLSKRRTSLAVRLLATAPSLARLLMDREEREHVARIAASDFVVYTGGTTLVEHYSFRKQLDDVIAAQSLGVPVFLYTQSMGPFRKPANRKLITSVLPRCEQIFLRDERSRQHLLDIGVPADRLSVHADAAFTLAGPVPAPRPVSERPRVAISVRAWSHARGSEGDKAVVAYRRAVAEAARSLARDGVEVVFLSTCQGIPEYWTDDSAFAQGIVRELLAGEPGISVDTSFRRPGDLLEAFGRFDVVIATRMHAAILSLLAGTPVVGIAYEFKTREMLRSFGHEELAVDFEDVTADWLVTRTRAAMKDRAALQAGIIDHVRRFRDDAIAPARTIRRMLQHQGATATTKARNTSP